MSKKIGTQVVFWVLIFIINLALFPMHVFRIDLVLVEFLCVLICVFLFYNNILYLFPKFYERKKIHYYLYNIALILLGVTLLFLLYEIVEVRSDLTILDEMRGGPHGRHHFDRMRMIVVFKQLLWMGLVFFIGTIYSIQNRLQQQMAHHKQVMEEKLKTELQLLKAQINPHFLFNALNNIYSLTYMRSEKAPESVLRLSEMLRYVIEDCCNESVPLKSEIAYINSFIDFYKMKNPGERDILFNVEIENPEVRIAPMLFIPFVENSFKYSRIEEDASGFIHLDLIENERKLKFSITNTIFSARTILSGSGKGIPNVKQRLEIIYPEKYKLSILPSTTKYSIELTIDLS